MSEGTTGEAEVVRLRQSLETQMRRRILEAIELVLEEGLDRGPGHGPLRAGGDATGVSQRAPDAADHDGGGSPDARHPARSDRGAQWLESRVP